MYPMYHPAAALRNGNLRSTLEKDFGELPAILKREPPEKQETAAESTRQMSLF